MRIVEMNKSFINNGIKFEAKHRYVMAEDVESQYRTAFGDAIGMSYPIEQIYRPYKGEDLNGKRLMTFRTGGIGDIFFACAPLRYIKKKYPSSFIRMASACKQPLENVPEIDELYDMPFDAKYLNDVDYHLFFQGIIESSSEISKKTHAVDMFFSYFGIDSIQMPREDKVPRVFFSKEEKDWLKGALEKLGINDSHYVIGLQMETSAPLRNFPKEKMKTVIDILVSEENVKIVLIGTDQHEILAQYFKNGNPNIILATRFSVRQSIVLSQRYNLVISPDSFMIQAAGAQDIPLIGLYGPFPSEVRMKYFKNAIGLDPSVVCAPCFKHDFRPCIKGFPSPCFSQLTVDDILQAANYLKTKTTGQSFRYMAQLMKTPDLKDIEQYMLSADKGLAIFPKYYKHHNTINLDVNPYTKPDISDLSAPLARDSFPFVVFYNDLVPKYITLYNNAKGLVRPGGYFIIYKENAHEALFSDVKMDLGRNFTLMLTKFDPNTRTMVVVGKRPY